MLHWWPNKGPPLLWFSFGPFRASWQSCRSSSTWTTRIRIQRHFACPCTLTAQLMQCLFCVVEFAFQCWSLLQCTSASLEWQLNRQKKVSWCVMKIIVSMCQVERASSRLWRLCVLSQVTPLSSLFSFISAMFSGIVFCANSVVQASKANNRNRFVCLQTRKPEYLTQQPHIENYFSACRSFLPVLAAIHDHQSVVSQDWSEHQHSLGHNMWSINLPQCSTQPLYVLFTQQNLPTGFYQELQETSLTLSWLLLNGRR